MGFSASPTFRTVLSKFQRVLVYQERPDGRWLWLVNQYRDREALGVLVLCHRQTGYHDIRVVREAQTIRPVS